MPLRKFAPENERFEKGRSSSISSIRELHNQDHANAHPRHKSLGQEGDQLDHFTEKKLKLLGQIREASEFIKESHEHSKQKLNGAEETPRRYLPQEALRLKNPEYPNILYLKIPKDPLLKRFNLPSSFTILTETQDDEDFKIWANYLNEFSKKITALKKNEDEYNRIINHKQESSSSIEEAPASKVTSLSSTELMAKEQDRKSH